MIHASPEFFTILVVCTGNICRSPLAQELLRAQLEECGIKAEVHSAGSFAMVGQGMTIEALDVSQGHGGQGKDHVATQLTQQAIVSADLVLTATREHRSAVAALYPRASRYTYTIKQFARLLPGALESLPALGNVISPKSRVELVETLHSDQAASLRALVSEVAATRGFSPAPASPTEDDIEDPYRLSIAVYERVGDQIHSAVMRIVEAFAKATRNA
ncbi:hypothetical protein [Cryobacterium soli]|uniref:arsenate reductase/protein-tyrosine-phosphatase family protein n=1 Tax=Cryobacterium soli TaxID=2220095 RepID=UPI000E740E30|nr:hypothetical protein [Cryobacterium soli]